MTPVMDRLEAARVCAHFFADGNVPLAEAITRLFIYPDCEESASAVARELGMDHTTLGRQLERFKSNLGRAFVTAGYVPESYANAEPE